jgi:SAM-dependent methyltransferase
MLELEEVHQLLEGRRDNPPVDKDDIEIAIQALLTHQIVYPDTSLLRRDVYDLIRRHSTFFERYFSAMGVGLTIEPTTGMIALVRGRNRYGWQFTRLKKDETLTMLALRLALDDGLRAGLMDDMGRVETNTDEIFDRIRALAKVEPPPQQRLEEILRWLRKRGTVLLHEPDRFERVTPLTVLPGIRILVDDEFARTVREWIALGASGEFFAWNSEQRLAKSDQLTESVEGADSQNQNNVDAESRH